MRSFRIVIAGHGTLPAALLATAELICGEIPGLAAAGLQPTETPDHYAQELRAAIGHDHRRVLVLCDLLGGTPFNVAAAIARRSPRVVCLAGALSMAGLPPIISPSAVSTEAFFNLIEISKVCSFLLKEK